MLYDFSRAPKTLVRENITGFLELPYSGRQEVNWLHERGQFKCLKKTKKYTKCKLTHNPALGDLIVQLAKNQRVNSYYRDNAIPGCFK